MNCLYFQLSGGTTPLVVGHTLTGFLATFSPFFPKSGVKPSSEFKWIVLGVSIKMYFLCTLHLHHLSIKFSGLLCRRGPPLAESVPIHHSLPIPRPFTPPLVHPFNTYTSRLLFKPVSLLTSWRTVGGHHTPCRWLLGSRLPVRVAHARLWVASRRSSCFFFSSCLTMGILGRRF